MRKLWIRIGLGAAAVFVSGMFVITLGRQIKGAASEAIRDGGRVTVPLSMLPFELRGERVGSIREIQVRKSGPDRVKRIDLTVKLRGFDPADLSDCVVAIGGPGRHDLFHCVSEADARSRGMVRIGEVHFTPSGVSRPIMLDRRHARGWADSDGGGAARVQLLADSAGALVSVRR